MGINIRTKGAEGEREIARMLNQIIGEVRANLKLPRLLIKDELFQRNQNQSAVGGDDLTNPIRLSIEVKRQEALSINTWWKQTIESAKRTDGLPVLLFRQNRQKWRCIMLVDIPLQPALTKRYAALTDSRAEITLDTFKEWFRAYYASWAMLETNG